MESRVVVILAVLTIVLLNFVVEHEAPSLGRHVTCLDLAVQSLKTYLIEKYGLSGSDWDPYSYLGRPPLANYPIVPFVVLAAVHKFLVKNILLATCVGEELLRLIPIVVWVILQALNLSSTESTIALLTYLALYPIVTIYEVKFTRIATTMSYSLVTVAVILWSSKLRNSIKKVLCLASWTTSLYSNFIYSVPPLVVVGILDSPIFFLPIIVASPILLFASGVGKLEFDNLPESTTMGFSIFDVYNIVFTTIMITLVTLLLTPLLTASRRKNIIVGLIVLIPLLGLAVFLSPKIHYLILSISKTLTQLDMYRMPLTACMLMIIIAPKIFAKTRLSFVAYSVVIALIGVGIAFGTMSHIPTTSIITKCEFSSFATVSHNYRTSNAHLGPLSLACPVDTPSERPTYVLGGGFYQGCSEVSLRVLASVLFLNGGGRDCCEQLAHPGQCQLFSEYTARKVLALLPVTTVDYGPNIKRIRTCSDVTGFTFNQRPALSLWDVIPATNFRVIYVGSYTDYSFLWLNLVRNAPTGYFPMIPLIRPYNVEHGQSLSDEQIPWSGDVLVVDSEALRYPRLKELARKAREVVVVYSSRAFDLEPPSKVVRRLRGVARHVYVLGPVHRPLHSPIVEKLVRKSCVRLNPVRNALHRISNDRYSVDPEEHRFVIVPWAWAPFWSVNGREGQTCPIGPYMLVRTDGKPTSLHYVAWERHQSRAYELSFLLLVASMTAAVIPNRVRAAETGAEGRS